MLKKVLLVFSLIFTQSVAQAYVQACLKTMESTTDVTRLNHKEIDTLLHDLIRSVNTRNIDAMLEVHETCSFLNNTDYLKAKKALHWLKNRHNELAADLKRPKIKNKKLVDYL